MSRILETTRDAKFALNFTNFTESLAQIFWIIKKWWYILYICPYFLRN